MNFKTYHSTFANVLSNTAASHLEARAQAETKFADSQAQADKRAMQRHNTHAIYDTRVAALDDSALKVAHQLDIKPEVIATQSREFKKRLVICMNAVASGTRVSADRPIDALMQFLVAKDRTDFTLREFQREARHETKTQAGYAKRFFTVLGCVESYDRTTGTVQMSADRDTIFNRLLRVYRSESSGEVEEVVRELEEVPTV